MKVFAHRGFSGKYPENTMLAYRKAIEAKADGIELDIHESSDGQLVIIHDEKLVRTRKLDLRDSPSSESEAFVSVMTGL